MSFVLKKDELSEVLNNVLKEKKMIRISSTTHAIGIMKNGENYVFYDPNAEQGEKEFSGPNAVNQLQAHLEDTLYGKFGRSTENMPLDIRAFDHVSNEPSHYNKTALETVISFVDNNNDIDRMSWNKKTSLMIASRNGEVDIARFLINQNANLNLQDDDGKTALISAAEKGHTDIVKALLEKGALLDIKDKNSDYTAQDWAIVNGHKEIAD